MKEIARKNIATPTNTLNVLLSLLRCIKILSTKKVLSEAISNAVATVNLPISIPATATVIAVKDKSASQTRIYML